MQGWKGREKLGMNTNGYGVSFWGDEYVLELESHDAHIIL